MTRHPNLAASVAARLLNRAKETGDDYQTPIPDNVPIALTRAYWDNPSRPAQKRRSVFPSGPCHVTGGRI